MNKEQMKAALPKLFDFQSFEDHNKHIEQFVQSSPALKPFVDATGGIVAARNLTHVSNEVFTQQYAPLTFLNTGIVINNEGGYANAISKVKTGAIGEHRLAGDNTNTNGLISLSGEADYIRVWDYEAESHFSETEVKRCLLENINLPSRLMAAHNEKWAYKIDEIGYVGIKSVDGAQKRFGLLNSEWETDSATATAAEMDAETLYNAIAGLIVAQDTRALGNESFTTKVVVMPRSVALEAAKKTFLQNGIMMTVIGALKGNFPQVDFVATQKAEAGQAAFASITLALSNDRAAMQMRVPVPLQISNVHVRGFKSYFESRGSIGGLDIIEQDAATALTGL